MPQSKKDSQGGKTHAAKKTPAGDAASAKAADKKSGGRSAASPTGANKQGEKKSTPH
jgi:hypothetical protein